MKYVPAFALLAVAIALFIGSILGGGLLLIAVGLITLVISERLFRWAHRRV